jgi:phenylpropionate dioxygenase-like ring-hydroxylating dioxygenase large terminal subunit
VRAFHNICSHRGNKIIWDNGGSCRCSPASSRLVLWMDGKLTFVPDEERFFALPKETLG